MRQSDQHGHKSSGTSLTAWLPVLAAAAIMATGCLSTFLVLQLDEFRPKVGDMVVFRAGSQDADGWQVTIPATVVSPDGQATATCTLDPNVIAAKGGSLVVEARQDQPTLLYRVRWAGEHTAQGGTDCGTSASLDVTRTDLQRLANAAGGFGVGNKGVTP
ncbi:hypothetical protein [Rhodopila sp.]|jgi:hypothetical protein|uniref:hypothetical protein n=1 Tax=Rhodopila sp. TaxID=2480087 RepID=UPI002C963E7B|nr:hypothetical protein [Rhodopila sp.]HVZ07261.1 hypothetical protein [Rhodopila sp.]